MEVDGTELEDIVSAIPEPQEKLNRSRLVRVGSVGSIGRYRMGSGYAKSAVLDTPNVFMRIKRQGSHSDQKRTMGAVTCRPFVF